MITNEHCYDKDERDELEAPVRLRLSELKWIESQMCKLRRIFLDQTDVLNPDGKAASILVTVETILWKVLDTFSEKYLDRESEDKSSFLTADEGIFHDHGREATQEQ